jgi:gliding motility-associatede transport system auxiliary component
MMHAETVGDLAAALWFPGVLIALAVLFAAGLRLPIPAPGFKRWLARGVIVGGATGATILANMVLYRHDAQLDVTREQAFTPSLEAREIVRRLRQPVDLTYFYQKQDPAARGVKTMLELLGRLNPNLRVETVDTDQNPALANRMGVRVYNTAVLRAGDRRIEVLTTDERDIALAILRVTRARETVICFATGHGEYDIDNFEFHTHFEGAQGHSHSAEGMAVVQMEQHGLGRLRRALEKLGLAARKVAIAGGQHVPKDCAALVEANPRTRYAPPEAVILRAYLERGGGLLMLIEPDYPIDEALAAVLAEAGVRVGDGVVADPLEHYFTDEQMIAVTKYARHPITQGLALSIYPGARPVASAGADRVETTVLFSSSGQAYLIADRARVEQAATAARGALPLAVAAEGRLGGASAPFRLLVVGDADFASNSFFPYLSNADFVLGGIAWLIHEEKAPTMKPPVEVLPMVALTGAQVRWIFIATVLLLPGSVALLGGLVWWRRRA